MKKNLMKAAILPEDSDEAMSRMLKLTRDIKGIAEAEAVALSTQDAAEMKILIARKNDLSFTYEQAGREFHARIEEFTKADPALIKELKREQEALQEIVHKNSKFYQQVRDALN